MHGKPAIDNVRRATGSLYSRCLDGRVGAGHQAKSEQQGELEFHVANGCPGVTRRLHIREKLIVRSFCNAGVVNGHLRCPSRMSDHTAQTLNLEQFAAHFERAAPALWCVAAGVLGSRDAAEDVVQEAALQAMAKLATFRADTDFTAWMATIVRYTAFNQMRRRHREPKPFHPDGPEPIAPAPTTTIVAANGEIRPEQLGLDDHVLNGLNSLHEAQRTCLLLRTVLELSYREIGEMLDIPVGTAMSHVHRARQQLVDQLRDTPAGATNARKAQ